MFLYSGLQEPNLFDITIQKNIAYGLTEEVCKDDLGKIVEDAAKAANASGFIEKFPKVGMAN